MKTPKTYKHITLIQLSDIRTLFDIDQVSLTIDGNIVNLRLDSLTVPFFLLKKLNNLESFVQSMVNYVNLYFV